MKYLSHLFFFLFTSLLLGQDTLYLDAEYNPVAPEKASYYRIDDRSAPGEQDLKRKTFKVNGQIKAERNFIEKRGKLRSHGVSKRWYENGQLFYSENYRKGERHGELIAFWEDGSLRRKDFYKKGKLVSGKVWNKDGKEVPHSPVFVPATFPGGNGAIAAYLKKHIPTNPKQRRNTEYRVVTSLQINKEGYISKVEILEEDVPLWYKAVTVQALMNMPQWSPGMFMDEAVNVKYTLPVTFRKN